MANKRKSKPSGGKSANIKKESPSRYHAGAIVVGLLFAFVLCYLGGNIYAFINKPKIPETVVESGNVELPKTVTGIIIRDEVVYKSPSDGSVYFNFNDHDRVKNDSDICSIQDDDNTAELSQSISDIEQSILEMQNRRGEISAYGKEAQRKNQQIQELVDNSLGTYVDGNFSAIYDLKTDISRNVNLRNQMYLSEEKGSVKDMVAEKNSYQQMLADNAVRIKNQQSGILSYGSDGLEEVLTFETLEHILPEQTRMSVDPPESKSFVKAGENVFKIIKSNEWYIAAYIPYNLISDWEEGAGKTIYIQRQGKTAPLNMTIEKITQNDEECFVLLKSTVSMLDYVDMRSVELRIAESEKKGFKIPNSAIADKTLLKIPADFVYTNNDRPYILKRNGESDETVTIKVQSESEGFIYVIQDFNSVKLGDILVDKDDKSKTTSVSELVNIRGVFAIRGGYAEFIQIKSPDQFPSPDGYTVIDPDENRGIKEFDKIITDVSNISDGQKIY